MIVGRRLSGGRGSSGTSDCLELGSLGRRSSRCKFYFQNFLFPLFTHSVYACSGGLGGVSLSVVCRWCKFSLRVGPLPCPEPLSVCPLSLFSQMNNSGAASAALPTGMTSLGSSGCQAAADGRHAWNSASPPAEHAFAFSSPRSLPSPALLETITDLSLRSCRRFLIRPSTEDLPLGPEASPPVLPN